MDATEGRANLLQRHERESAGKGQKQVRLKLTSSRAHFSPALHSTDLTVCEEEDALEAGAINSSPSVSMAEAEAAAAVLLQGATARNKGE